VLTANPNQARFFAHSSLGGESSGNAVTKSRILVTVVPETYMMLHTG
jgi:hypothetical protein